MALTTAERNKRYRLAHPDRINAKNARWRRANPDKANKRDPVAKAAKAARYAARHVEHLRDYHRGYKQRPQMKEKNRLRREWLNGLKSNPCMDCGGRFHPAAMDFDHVRGEKVKHVGAMLLMSKEAVLAEIDKCDLVCSNCHRVRTSERRQCGPKRHAA